MHSGQNARTTYIVKNGVQHTMNPPTMMPSVLAAFVSILKRFTCAFMLRLLSLSTGFGPVPFASAWWTWSFALLMWLFSYGRALRYLQFEKSAISSYKRGVSDVLPVSIGFARDGDERSRLMTVFRGVLRLKNFESAPFCPICGAFFAGGVVRGGAASAESRFHVKYFVRLRRVRHVLAQAALAGGRRGGRNALLLLQLPGERLVGSVAAQVAIRCRGGLRLRLRRREKVARDGCFRETSHDVATAESGESRSETRGTAAVFREQDRSEGRRFLR